MQVKKESNFDRKENKQERKQNVSLVLFSLRKGERKAEQHRGMETGAERRTGEKRNGCKFCKSIGGEKSLGSNVLHVKGLLWSRATESMVQKTHHQDTVPLPPSIHSQRTRRQYEHTQQCTIYTAPDSLIPIQACVNRLTHDLSAHTTTYIQMNNIQRKQKCKLFSIYTHEYITHLIPTV